MQVLPTALQRTYQKDSLLICFPLESFFFLNQKKNDKMTLDKVKRKHLTLKEKIHPFLNIMSL